MRFRPVLLSIALLLLAGCGSLAGGNATQATESNPAPTTTAGTATTAPTASPNPTTEITTPATPTPTLNSSGPGTDASGYPPGVNRTGLVNATALERANRASLVWAGFTAVAVRNVTSAVETRDRSVRTVVGAGGYPYSLVERDRVNGSLDRETERWANETIRLTRYRSNASAAYRYQYRGNPDTVDAAAERIGLFTLLADGAYEQVTVDGTAGNRRFTLTATSADLDERRAAHANVTAYRGTLVVDGNGTVRRANVTATIETPAGNGTVHATYDLTEHGRETVAQPAWVRQRIDDVLNASVRVTLLDDRFLRVENTGAAIPAGSTFVLWYDGCGRATNYLRAPLEPGETLYLSVSAYESYDLGINRTGPGGPARVIDHPTELVVYPPSDDDEQPEPLVSTNVAVDGSATTNGSSASLYRTAGAALSRSTAC